MQAATCAASTLTADCTLFSTIPSTPGRSIGAIHAKGHKFEWGYMMRVKQTGASHTRQQGIYSQTAQGTGHHQYMIAGMRPTI